MGVGHSNSRVVGSSPCDEEIDEIDTDNDTSIMMKNTNKLYLTNSQRSFRKSSTGSLSYNDDDLLTPKRNIRYQNYRHKPFSRLPQFISALQSDESIWIACYDSLQRLDYLSDCAYHSLGYDLMTPIGDISFPISPRRGNFFYRLHQSGSLLKFRNLFQSQLTTGETFTMDEFICVVENISDSCFTLMVTSSGIITRCDMISDNKDFTSESLVGHHLEEVVTCGDLSNVMTSILKASEGDNCSNVLAYFSKIAVTVSMDLFPCTDDGHVVIIASLIPDANVFNGTLGDPSLSKIYSKPCSLFNLYSEIGYVRDFRNHAILPMVSISSEGTILWANDCMISKMGFDEHPLQFLGSMMCDFFADKEMFCKLFDGQRVLNVTCDLRRRNGDIWNVFYNSNAKLDSNGTVLYTRCILYDVTECSNLQSDDTVEVAKLHLNTKLTELEAAAKSKAKSDFLAVMSHELRTPLNGILGASSLLEITSLNGEQRDYVDTINDSAHILFSLIGNILDISKLDNGNFELDSVPLRLVDVILACSGVMKYRASEKGLSITTDISPDLNGPNIWYRGDPTRIKQVLLNLFSNAVKFTQTGGVYCKLTKLHGDISALDISNIKNSVSMSGNDGGGKNSRSSSICSSVDSVACSSNNARYDWFRLEVTDTGCGVSADIDLFAPFVQADESIHKKFGGTGLGLCVSKQIVELMQGRIGMSSIVGDGTTVWAEFPLRQSSGPRKGPDFVPVPSLDVIKLLHSHSTDSEVVTVVRILIAEDNKVNQKVLKRMLETLGYADITVTNNGQEAVEAYKNAWEGYLADSSCGRFDIVLMDCLMPVMDGWLATEVIRSIESHFLQMAAVQAVDSPIYYEAQPTIVLALTANATAEDKERCRKCGMDEFYTKPMSRDGLNAMMLLWVSKLFDNGTTGGCTSDRSTFR
jgi:signal transduction histidine kinase/CheY-like chemotaxis protein